MNIEGTLEQIAQNTIQWHSSNAELGLQSIDQCFVIDSVKGSQNVKTDEHHSGTRIDVAVDVIH